MHVRIAQGERIVIKTRLCGTCKYVECTFVPSQLAAHADIVIIGEAPGAEEERAGMPFVGPSGRMLRKTLTDTGFDMSKISIMNTVRCRPPENETPGKKAVSACTQQFLFNEIQTANPKTIVCAGAVAAAVFPGDTWQGIPVVKIYHPAALLYDPSKEPKFRQDIRKLYNTMYPKKAERELIVIDTMDGIEIVRKWIADKKIVACDIETNGTLDPFALHARILCVAFGDSKIGYSVSLDKDTDPVFTEQAATFVKEMLLDASKTYIFHRCWFDVKFLQARGFEVKKYTDTRLMSFLLNENRKEHGLKELTSEFIGPYEYQMEAKNRHEFGLYNAEDVVNTHKLYEIFAGQMTPGLTKVLNRIILPAMPVINEMMLTGMRIDQNVAKALKKELQKDRDEAYNELLNKFKVFRGINLASPDQMQAVLYGALKKTPVKKTKTGFSVDEETMNTYAYEGEEWARLIVRMRKQEKLLSTYVDKIPGMVNVDGRIRTQFDPMGTVTGRYNSKAPNLQNIPRDDRIYRMFVADEGKQLIYFDFAALELRVACSIAYERKMIQAFNDKIDLHIRTATFITGKKPEAITKEERQLAKGASFGLLYGQQAEGLKRYLFDKFNIDIALEEAERIREVFFEAYNGLPLWHNRVAEEVRNTCQVAYPTGRLRRFPQVKALGKVPGEVFRQAVNSPVQGSGNDVVVFSTYNLHRLIKKRKLPVKFVLTVHDSVIMEAEDSTGIVDEVKDLMDVVLAEVLPNDDLFRWIKVPMCVEWKTGKSWGDLK